MKRRHNKQPCGYARCPRRFVPSPRLPYHCSVTCRELEWAETREDFRRHTRPARRKAVEEL